MYMMVNSPDDRNICDPNSSVKYENWWFTYTCDLLIAVSGCAKPTIFLYKLIRILDENEQLSCDQHSPGYEFSYPSCRPVGLH